MKILSRLTLFSLLMFAAASSHTTVKAQPTIEDVPSYDKDKLSLAPPKLVKDFVKAVQESEFYKMAVAIAPKSIEKMTAEWTELNPAGLNVNSVSLLTVLAGQMEFRIGDDDWLLDTTTIDGPFDTYREAFVLEMSRNSADDPKKRELFKYEVRPSDLKELNFDILNNVYILHPLSRVLKKHDVSNETLTDVITGLCHEAGVDYSIRADLADNLRITQRLHNKSIFECLNMAARTTGWTVSIESTRVHSGRSVDFESIFQTYNSRDYINATERLDKPIKSQIDALDYLVRQHSKLLQKAGAVVMVKKPKEPNSKD